MDVLRVGFGALLGAWTLLTIINNTPWLDRLVFSRLHLGRWAALIPSWSFFAPRPADRDQAVFYRDRDDTGGLSPWRELPVSTRYKGLAAILWNPDSRPKKAISDAVSHLLRLAPRSGPVPDHIVLSVPYLLLLNRISHIPRGPGVTGRQFLVVRHSIARPDPEVLIVSHVHDLEP
jgi:hypothetical protein